MLDWIDNETPGPWRRGLEPPLLAVVTFVTTLALADMSSPALRGWWHGEGGYLAWLDIYWLLEPGTLTPWLVALAVALAMGYAVARGWSRRKLVRAVGGLLSLASLTGLALLVASRPEVHVARSGGGYDSHPAALPWPAMLGLMAGGFGGLWIAIGQGLTVRQSGLRRGGVALATVAASLVLGAPTLGDVLDEYQPQTFRRFQGQLVAVARIQKGTHPAGNAQVITYEKKNYVVLKSPKPLWFTDKDLRRVRLRDYRDYRGHHTAISIRFASKLHDRIARRTRHLARYRYLEALYLDGELWMVAPVEGAIHGGRVLITDNPQNPRPLSRRLHKALSR